jgi:DNA repair exonuclease SbcCD ATPase subunit
MRLRQLTLTGFTGVADTVELDLDAEIVILLAANGFGKSTICDGIAWCLTGRHPREADPRSLHSRSGETYAALTLSVPGEQDIIVRRRIDNPAEPRADRLTSSVVVDSGRSRWRAAEASVWLWERLLPSADMADASGLASVMTDGYYLQQESLREFLVGRSDDERFAALSRMVGAGALNDFVRAFDSAKTAWSRAVNDLQRETEELANKLQAAKAALDALAKESSAVSTDDLQTRVAGWLASAANQLPEVGPTTAPDPIAELEQRASELRRASIGLAQRSEQIAAALAEAQIPEAVEAHRVLPVSGADLDAALAAVDAAEAAVDQADNAVADAELELRVRRGARRELANLAELALHHVSDTCPTCGQDVNPAAFESRLRDMLAATDSADESAALADALKRRGEAQGALAQAQAELAVLQQRNNEAKRVAAAMDAAAARKRAREARLADLLGLSLAEVEPVGILGKAATFLHSLDLHRQAIAALLKDADGLRARARMAVDPRRVHAAEAQVAALTEQHRSLHGDLEVRQATGALADALSRALKRDAEGFLNERLQEIQPVLDQLYAAIDPHPTFREVRLLTGNRQGKNRLMPVVTDEAGQAEMRDPGRTLSTSQANALAVTIFLAFNLGLTPTQLQTVVLDDPLQNLDDVHLLGLVDLLRRIRPYRQLIIITHDAAFASLLGRKLRPLEPGRSVRVLRIVKWDRDGPQIEMESVEAEESPMKLAIS